MAWKPWRREGERNQFGTLRRNFGQHVIGVVRCGDEELRRAGQADAFFFRGKQGPAVRLPKKFRSAPEKESRQEGRLRRGKKGGGESSGCARRDVKFNTKHLRESARAIIDLNFADVNR